ncbi:MAG TPA: FAD-binding oxidoreductase, partial [Gaiellales bacterium]|nr:FAD-binding oxidoreductase [Gaiellales bacterium]
MVKRMTHVSDRNSLWLGEPAPRAFRKLDRDRSADVVIVGGGFTGLTTAYLLGSAGKNVVVLERETCAAIDSGHTSAHLTMVTDTWLSEFVNSFGRDHAQAVWDAGRAAIAEIEAIVER